MNTIKIEAKQAFMIAHRGVSGLEPENSIPSFTAAGNRSYYGIETDIHVTKDGKFIVIHDEQTGRVAGEDVNVEELTYDEVRKLRLNNICGWERWNHLEDNPKSRPDLILPSLEEYVNICKKYEKKCVLELKNRFSREDIVRVVEQIKELGYLENVIFISFVLENLIDLRSLLPEQELQFLVGKWEEETVDWLNQYSLELDIAHTILTKEIIDLVHANNHKVNCWICNRKEDADRLIEWGVDLITSDILEDCRAAEK
ncbi:MAG: hypothetical protein J6B85_06260 [Lachnospiraceae bacterium]|nr:hypothetical protein [Lachnospiraceae bacterium]